jgi:hypothetical protein
MNGPRAAESQRNAPRSDAAVYEAPAVLRLLRADPPVHAGAPSGLVAGGPFIVLLPVAFCAAMLDQAHMALELAELAGYAPDDEMRAGDLLVIQGAYASTTEASVAAAKLTLDPKRRAGTRLPRGTRISMVKRMAFMLGFLGSSDEKPSRLRSALQMALVGAVFVVGLLPRLVWVPYMAYAFRKSGLQTGRRASAFYAKRRSEEAGVTVTKSPTVRIAMSAGVLRMLALIAGSPGWATAGGGGDGRPTSPPAECSSSIPTATALTKASQEP